MSIEILGANKRTIKSITESVQQILTRDEVITAIAVQRKLVGLKPDAIVVTNKRCIIYRPSLFSTSFSDALWRDIEDVRLEQGFLSAQIRVLLVDKSEIVIKQLSKSHARRVYALAQEKEQEAEEVRRQRTLEEERARAGGIVMGAGVSAAEGIPGQPSGTMAKLSELKGLLDAGLITQEEYEQKKSQILSKM